MPIPANPKIYHIAHIDRLASIGNDGWILSDAAVRARAAGGTVIGMNTIKARRLQLPLSSHPTLKVGECAPFYFCPRSVMLYLIHMRNAELAYQGGQGPIVHLQADLHAALAWATQNNRRWAFTLSNAGAYYFEDRCDVAHLGEINWAAVEARKWGGNGVDRSVKEGKQAEFLMEAAFPWHLIESVTVQSGPMNLQADAIIKKLAHRPPIFVRPDWYY